MALSRTELAKKLNGVDNQDEIIDYIMAENGKQINSLRAENEELKTQLLDAKNATTKVNNEFTAYKESVKDFDTFKQENEKLKAQIKTYDDAKKNEAYFQELSKVGVDDKFKNFVFSEVKPNENEKVEDYNARVNKYLEENTQFKSENYGKINSQLNFKDGKSVDFTKMTDEEYIDLLESVYGKEITNDIKKASIKFTMTVPDGCRQKSYKAPEGISVSATDKSVSFSYPLLRLLTLTGTETSFIQW